MGFDVKNRKATLYDEGKAKYDTTTLPAVEAAVVSILSHPEKYQNESVHIHSFTTSQKEVLDAVIAESGDSNWEIEQASAEKWYNEGFDMVAKGDYSGFANLIFGSIYEGSYGSNYAATEKIRNEELGLPKQNVLDEVKKALAKM
jgi:hypothetical protein